MTRRFPPMTLCRCKPATAPDLRGHANEHVRRPPARERRATDGHRRLGSAVDARRLRGAASRFAPVHRPRPGAALSAPRGRREPGWVPDHDGHGRVDVAVRRRRPPDGHTDRAVPGPCGLFGTRAAQCRGLLVSDWADTLDRQHSIVALLTSVNGLVILWLASIGGLLP